MPLELTGAERLEAAFSWNHFKISKSLSPICPKEDSKIHRTLLRENQGCIHGTMKDALAEHGRESNLLPRSMDYVDVDSAWTLEKCFFRF